MRYELCPQSKQRLSFIPDDLRYFNDRFIGEPMSEGWTIPTVSTAGTSYKAADFVLWMLCAPVVSLRVREALANICMGLVEFLPFHTISKSPYFAMNVLSRDTLMPIYKTSPNSVVYVDERFGAIVRNNGLTGLALADPENDIGRRIVRGESLHDFPGLLG